MSEDDPAPQRPGKSGMAENRPTEPLETRSLVRLDPERPLGVRAWTENLDAFRSKFGFGEFLLPLTKGRGAPLLLLDRPSRNPR